MKTIKKVIEVMIICFLLHSKLYAQVLETEDANPLAPGQIHLETSARIQTDADSRETAWEAEVKYRLSKRLMFSVEPAMLESINPDSGVSVTGFGDTEVTLFVRMLEEKKVLPSMSLALEAKIPTAQHPLIGTGKVDFTPIFIANKTTGKFFTSINFGYTFIGKPDSVLANNFMNYGIATIYTPAKASLLFAEVYGSTASVDPEKYPETILPHSTIQDNPEFGGSETVFSIGYGYDFQNGWLLSFSVSYDNSNALLLQAGIEWESMEKKLKNAITDIKKKVEKE